MGRGFPAAALHRRAARRTDRNHECLIIWYFRLGSDSEVRKQGLPRVLAAFTMGTADNAQPVAATDDHCSVVRRHLWRSLCARSFRAAEVTRNFRFDSAR